jgi:hypothetical protein
MPYHIGIVFHVGGSGERKEMTRDKRYDRIAQM